MNSDKMGHSLYCVTLYCAPFPHVSAGSLHTIFVLSISCLQRSYQIVIALYLIHFEFPGFLCSTQVFLQSSSSLYLSLSILQFCQALFLVLSFDFHFIANQSFIPVISIIYFLFLFQFLVALINLVTLLCFLQSQFLSVFILLLFSVLLFCLEFCVCCVGSCPALPCFQCHPWWLILLTWQLDWCSFSCSSKCQASGSSGHCLISSVILSSAAPSPQFSCLLLPNLISAAFPVHLLCALFYCLDHLHSFPSPLCCVLSIHYTPLVILFIYQTAVTKT